MHFKWREVTAFRLLALFLALLLWVYVTHQRNPVMERAARIDLHQRGLPEDVVVQDMPSSVTVYYKSSKGMLALVDAEEFQATVNLAGAGKGTHSFPVQVTGPAGVEVVRVNPERVTISLDRIIVKDVPVAVNVLGSPAPGYHRLEPVVTPPVVEALGPSEVLEEIDRVAVSVDIRGTPTGVEQVRPVSTGLENVELRPESVRVTVPVEPLPSRTINVEPRITGSPAQGFRVETVSVNPTSVKVTGDQDLLSGLRNIVTEPVNISEATGVFSRNVRVVIPEGISSVEPVEVEVTIQLEEEIMQDEETGTEE